MIASENPSPVPVRFWDLKVPVNTPTRRHRDQQMVAYYTSRIRAILKAYVDRNLEPNQVPDDWWTVRIHREVVS
jgi:hypothetical protein